jgi:predicted heme/steroid binding protein
MDNEELGRFNGEDGAPAYVAYKGKVYDASASKLWRGGLHMGSHRAGHDLTDYISLAPHSDSVLAGLAVVGELSARADDGAGGDISDPKQKLRDLYRKYHPHPVLLHYPVGAFAFAALMQALFILTKDASLERSAFYALIFALVTTIPTILSGFLSRHVNYEDALTPIFKAKIYSSAALVLTASACAAIRFLHPDVSVSGGALTVLYDALMFLNVPVIGVAAYNGGKITWPS